MTTKKYDKVGDPPADDERYAAVEGMMQRFDYQKDALVEVLIAAQEHFGHLSRELLTYVSDRLQIPLSQVYGVATFYDLFTVEAGETHCLVCTGPVCSQAGAGELLAETQRQAKVPATGIASADGKYVVKQATCLGLCDQAPAALVDKVALVHLTPGDVPAMLRGEGSSPTIRVDGEPRVLTAPIGRLAPTDLSAHRAEGAFAALEQALTEMTPVQVIEAITASGLMGRGGAGFPTGRKWQFAREALGQPKYAVCNFDESEPGTFKDRALMEGNPFRTLEGLIISAYAIGARNGYVFIRGEYPAANAVLDQSLDALYAAGLLGDHILGTDFSFDIEVRHNAGAYVCGEETALFEAIEGKRGHPRSKPPFPTVQGLFGKPTVINNVETLAVVPDLVRHGGGWFQQWGTSGSVGLKLFCLSGHVERPGVVEVPYGLSVRELVERFGGGFLGEPQAVLVGGAAGGFLYPDELDTPLTHETLRPFDVPIGSGAIMVFNQSVDLWQVIAGLAHFFVHETCGLCAPCRLGTRQIYKLTSKVSLGTDATADLEKLEELGQMVRSACRCGLGMTTANPLLTVLHHGS